jgi:hypothetical protein
LDFEIRKIMPLGQERREREREKEREGRETFRYKHNMYKA